MAQLQLGQLQPATGLPAELKSLHLLSEYAASVTVYNGCTTPGSTQPSNCTALHCPCMLLYNMLLTD